MSRKRSNLPAQEGGALGSAVFIAATMLLAGVAGTRPAVAGRPARVQAQASSGQIVGAVLAKSGAAVPDATVTATNKDTGLVREVITNQLGEYRLVSLPPGRYSLTVRHEGFKTFEAADVVVDVGAAITENATLPTGEVSVAVGATATSATPLPMKKNKKGLFGGLKSFIGRIRGRGRS